MKVILKNCNLVFASKPLPEEHSFDIAYADVVIYKQQVDVNLIYIGDIHTGDKVTINFDQDNTGRPSIVFLPKASDGSYKDGGALGYLRWTGTKIGPVTATDECSNLKLFLNSKEGTVIETAGKISGKVTIERA